MKIVILTFVVVLTAARYVYCNDRFLTSVDADVFGKKIAGAVLATATNKRTKILTFDNRRIDDTIRCARCIVRNPLYVCDGHCENTVRSVIDEDVFASQGDYTNTENCKNCLIKIANGHFYNCVNHCNVRDLDRVLNTLVTKKATFDF